VKNLRRFEGKIKRSCEWVPDDALYIDYHDTEWGVLLHDDQRLFEFLVLQGMQAGLSWRTILQKRENFREAFDHFDASKVARYDKKKVEELLCNRNIIRNRRKIEVTIQNAEAFLEIQQEFGSFNTYIWKFVGGKPKKNAWKTIHGIPAKTSESDAMSQELIDRGFKFVGPTICYAFMQAVGMVNDHTIECFRYDEILKLSKEIIS
jgi:DNA-3-methyladenine glycosylase I